MANRRLDILSILRSLRVSFPLCPLWLKAFTTAHRLTLWLKAFLSDLHVLRSYPFSGSRAYLDNLIAFSDQGHAGHPDKKAVLDHPGGGFELASKPGGSGIWSKLQSRM